jgi:Ca2+/Na+ antiporter
MCRIIIIIIIVMTRKITRSKFNVLTHTQKTINIETTTMMTMMTMTAMTHLSRIETLYCRSSSPFTLFS